MGEAGRSGPPAPRGRAPSAAGRFAARRHAPRGWLPFLALALLFVALRVPSLLEPPTLADEGTYADIGWALDHGAVLYRDVWGHYTPGAYWVGAAITLVSQSVLSFHLVLAAAVAITAVAVWFLTRRFAAAPVAWAAAAAFVVVSSLPTLEGDVLYVEALGTLPAVLAALVVARRAGVPSNRSAVGAGILVGAAIIFKVTFAADAVAVATFPAIAALASGRRPGRRELRILAAMVGGTAGIVAVAAVGLWLGGSMPGLVDVLTHQDELYLQASAAGGAAGGTAGAGTGSALLVLSAGRVAVVLGGGITATWLLARRRRVGASIATWWLTWDLAAVVVSGIGLAHYVQQMAPPMCICAALLVARLSPRLSRHELFAAAGTAVIAWSGCVVALVAPTAEASLAVRQQVTAFASSIVSPAQVGHVVGRGWQRAIGLIGPARYTASFGHQPALVDTTVRTIELNSRPGDRVFVWGRLPWVYALSRRMPAGRYTSLNSSYHLDPRAQRILVDELRARPPTVFVAIDPLPAEVIALLHDLHYRPLAHRDGSQGWVRA